MGGRGTSPFSPHSLQYFFFNLQTVGDFLGKLGPCPSATANRKLMLLSGLFFFFTLRGHGLF